MSVGAFLSTHPLPPFIIALAIAIPSLILYVVEVIVIIKYSSQFKSAFFRLFILRFILNFLNSLALIPLCLVISHCLASSLSISGSTPTYD
ncbi:hypothetical protein DdX_18700 [Ditylenchus destructor]|uniref:Uncharacterized protein n=1 Tax=Ditylenchus destructor TaxID=166010 RepID=A0AAD4ML21_9BILA|nr:hypothetical protein DdX_18700 [Ditylenchus destructor]